jgi:CHAT domain-containing protein/tetratricopeptide (TPR) repeat protein
MLLIKSMPDLAKKGHDLSTGKWGTSSSALVFRSALYRSLRALRIIGLARGAALGLVICIATSPAFVLAQGDSERDSAQKEVSRLLIEATRLEVKGDYAAALPMLEQALSLAEQHFTSDSPLVYLCLKSLGTVYTDKEDFDRAKPILERAVAILEQDPESPKNELAESLHKLAVVYDDLGDFSRAEPLYERALALRQETLGPNNLEVAKWTNYLANLYIEKGDYPHAEALLQRAMEINEKLPNPDQMLIATLLNNLAEVYNAQHDHAKAEPLHLRAIAIAERVKPDSVDLATFLNNLGVMYSSAAPKKARPLLERALAIREKLLGPNNAEVGSSVNNLALLSWREGDTKQATQLLLRSLAIVEATHGPTHPQVAGVLNNLAFLYQAMGNTQEAITFLTRGSQVREHNLALIMARGSEDQKSRYIRMLTNEASATVSFQVRSAPTDAKATRLALTTILQRKGRILDALSNQLAPLRQHLDLPGQVLLDQLSASRAQLATLVIKGPQGDDSGHYAAAVKKLEAEAQTLEQKIGERAGEFRVQSEPITVERVQAAIPSDAALVEIARYRPATIKAGANVVWGDDRYVAYVLKHTGEPAWVELGAAALIDRDGGLLRAALRNRTGTDFRIRARTLDEAVMRPVRRLLGDLRQVLISPDGALNLVPFAALVDEQQRYLIENYTFTYLTSGRDLLRLEAERPSTEGPLVIANPQFDEPGDVISSIIPAPRNGGTRSGSLQEHFVPLSATADEARDVSNLLPGARLFTGTQASETALKRVHGPSILHVATHGFFLPNATVETQVSSKKDTAASLYDTPAVVGSNPLLRSGLALAGANERQGGNGEDGILTALEAAGLNLWGTKLVVLSACETGVGDVQNGEGVYGLRRAFVLAGADSEMMSLWKVDDEATRDLMSGFYKDLKRGLGRSEALRQVQLAMLKTADHQHPFFWAAFILSGDWRALSSLQLLGDKGSSDASSESLI